jgi:Domain of unknown function (DUF4383)
MTAGSQAAGGRSSRAGARESRRTPAQWYCLLAGLSLLLAGILGFFADASFTTGDGIDGDRLLSIFEVNGIHNLVHIASGLVLLAASPKRASAKTVAIAFGLVYGVVTIIGLIDGKDVLGLIPVNPSDNVLHIALSALGLIAGFMSRGRDDVPRDEARTVGEKRFDRERDREATRTR